MFDVAVIGAGVVGGMIARELSRYNITVCILEKENDVCLGASKANSAIVHAGFDAKEGSLKALLNVKGSEMMERVTSELGVPYKRNGSIVLGFSENDRKELEKLLQRGIINGVKGLKILEREELRALEKNISDEASCALYAPSGAIVCPYELTVAAIGNAMDNAVALKTNFCVKEIKKLDKGYRVFSECDFIDADVVINAAGINSDTVASMISDTSFNVHPRRGEYLLLDNECGCHITHTIFTVPTKMGKGILVTPTVDNNILLGPTSEDIFDKNDKSVTGFGIEKVKSLASQSVKNIPYEKVITSFCGLRSVGSSGDFIINSPKKGFINVAGIESPGLTASPAIAVYVRQLLEKECGKLSKKVSFNPNRRPMHYFKNASNAEKNKIIKENPAFGKIVCRCEKVTEGEILDALRQNPKACDLDGVKRRTRAQMGRCQGGFCTPSIMDIISRELSIPYENVTKNGNDSKIVFGKRGEECD